MHNIIIITTSVSSAFIRIIIIIANNTGAAAGQMLDHESEIIQILYTLRIPFSNSITYIIVVINVTYRWITNSLNWPHPCRFYSPWLPMSFYISFATPNLEWSCFEFCYRATLWIHPGCIRHLLPSAPVYNIILLFVTAWHACIYLTKHFVGRL